MATSQAQTTDRDRESTGRQMERVTFRAPSQQIDEVEALVDEGEFPSRSEAIRQAVRDLIQEDRP